MTTPGFYLKDGKKAEHIGLKDGKQAQTSLTNLRTKYWRK